MGGIGPCVAKGETGIPFNNSVYGIRREVATALDGFLVIGDRPKQWTVVILPMVGCLKVVADSLRGLGVDRDGYSVSLPFAFHRQTAQRIRDYLQVIPALTPPFPRTLLLGVHSWLSTRSTFSIIRAVLIIRGKVDLD